MVEEGYKNLPEVRKREVEVTKRFVVDVGSFPGATAFEKGTYPVPDPERESYVCVDSAPFLADESKGEFSENYTSVVGEAERLPFSDNSVDEVIVSNLFFTYRSKFSESQDLHSKEAVFDLIRMAFVEIKRVLNKGGKISITNTYSRLEGGEVQLDFLINLAQENGFEIADFTYIRDEGDKGGIDKLKRYASAIDKDNPRFKDSFQLILKKI